MYKAVQMDDGSIHLVHHGIKGQKWGERRFQYEDGSLTPEGKIRYAVEGNSEYHANSTKFIRSTKDRHKSEELDKAISDARNRESTGKKLVKSWLMDSSQKLTYDMARSTGSGRVGSFMRSVFDINVGSLLGGVAATVAADRIAAAVGVESKAARNAIRVGSFVAGRAVSRALAPSELSLQQRGMRNKTIRGTRKIERRP